jgi:ethanolamine-phosphate phospho-lyase
VSSILFLFDINNFFLGNGYPVAAVICRREVAESFAKSGIEYFNTYGGNSVACSIADAVFDTIQNEDLQQNALEVGNYLTAQLCTLAPKYDWIGDIRGVGLFQGIEFVKSRKDVKNLQPYPELTKFLVDFLRYERVIVSRDGPDENVIKIKPPLVFSKANVDQLVKALDMALECAEKSGLFKEKK